MRQTASKRAEMISALLAYRDCMNDIATKLIRQNPDRYRTDPEVRLIIMTLSGMVQLLDDGVE